MLHQMKLDIEPFGRIKDGEKTLEIRIYDEKRRKIGIGDEIEFSKRPDLTETVKVEVVGLLLYKNFADLIQDLPASYLGGYEESEKEYLKTSMYEIYTKEEEDEYGVLGIRIRLIGKDK
jgi:ASC-1-like (ASCH) protein